MKKARLTEEQIIGILQEHEAGAKCADLCRKHGMSEGTCLSLESEVFRDDSVGGRAAEGAGGRECQAEEAVGRADARYGGDEGTAVKSEGVLPSVRRRPER